jgi:AraC family transcriptional regulator
MERWEKINAVQRMQDYIAENVMEPITLHQLARVAGYSPWHSGRIFRELTGKTLFEYIRKYRLSQAAVKLRDEDQKIIDVAFDFVFDSHEGFTRAFSKQFGMTPNYYSQNTPPIQLFLPHRIREYYLTLQKGENIMSKKPNDTVFVQVVDRPARKLIVKWGREATNYFEYCDEVGCDVWGVLTSIKEAIYEPIGMWMPENLRKKGASKYVQGVEVPDNYNGEVPGGFDIIDLPPCKVMIFQGEPYEDEKFEEAIGSLWEVMKKYNPELYGFKWVDEDAPRFQLEPRGYRGYIEGRPVREISK